VKKKEKVKLNDDEYVDKIKNMPKSRLNVTKEDGLNLNRNNNLAIYL
jgi:hypothetical protein